MHKRLRWAPRRHTGKAKGAETANKREETEEAVRGLHTARSHGALPFWAFPPATPTARKALPKQ